ncbi:MAG: SMP-30/gluconolactonase/LRE family protein [Acidimicrobiales bacterium]|nr:SMP-30/gluconolactonase/LRE family protein [Acidimicrobiales bacterium]
MTSGVEVVATGFRFPEGPSVAPNGDIVVVELAGGRVSRVTPDGEVSTFAVLGGSPNGSAFGPDGNLYVCNGGGRWAAETSTGGSVGPADGDSLIQRVTPDGRATALIAAVGDRPLNAPNDICFDADGGFWFTDPAWPDHTGETPPGTICWSDTDGRVVDAHTGLEFPNGLGVTPDGATLIVAESRTNRLVAMAILGPGRLGEPRHFADLPGGFPDGLCFDAEGNVLCAGHGAGSVVVYPAAGGAAIETITFDDADITNVCFGGPDMTSLFVTESDGGRLVRVEREVPGMVLFPDRVLRAGGGD